VNREPTAVYVGRYKPLGIHRRSATLNQKKVEPARKDRPKARHTGRIRDVPEQPRA